MRPRASPAASLSSWSAPIPTSSACRFTKPRRCLPARVIRSGPAGSTGRSGGGRPSMALLVDLAEDVHLDRAGEHRSPHLQERLEPRIAGDLLAVRFQGFG